MDKELKFLVKKIDNFLCWGLNYSYKHSKGNGYFEGMSDAYYHFAYDLLNEAIPNSTIQDIMEVASEDAEWYSRKGKCLFYDGYIKGCKKINESLHMFERTYYFTHSDIPIKHVLSTITLESFAAAYAD